MTDRILTEYNPDPVERVVARARLELLAKYLERGNRRAYAVAFVPLVPPSPRGLWA